MRKIFAAGARAEEFMQERRNTSKGRPRSLPLLVIQEKLPCTLELVNCQTGQGVSTSMA